MRSSTRRMWVIAATLLALAAVACGNDQQPAGQGDDEPFRWRHYLGLSASPGSSPWFVGVEKGFFEDAGLDVEIIEGESPSAGPGLLVAGKAESASFDLGALALAKAEDPDLGLQMVSIHQAQTIHAIYSLKSGANIDQPEDLEGVTVLQRVGGTADRVIRIWAQREGYPVPKIDDADPEALDRLLLSGEAKATTGAILSRPALAAAAAEAGEELVVLELSKYGLAPFYGNGVTVDEEFASQHPEETRAFVEASLQAFQWCFDNKEEAGEIMARLFPTFSAQAVVAGLEELETVVTDDGTLDEIGIIDPAKIEATAQIVEEGFGIEVDPDSLYTTEYTD